ncbi:unnamed protein product [Didymodactylos carnosus]|uniref:Uncharacterized protein n=1 Tax=Didymodactylos carnosus TaxID=1234261 RepID=A0A8S2IS82_9BILA|nr:unnamed protein product [Didymodactylos carnosus]CAF3754511.1 unnamed protein product [Didymodactylos carnosus]
MAAQFVARHYKIPQISYGATSAIFTADQSEQYPYFLRTIPDLNLELNALAYFIHKQEWHNIALLYTSDRPNFHNVDRFINSTKSLNITILTRRAFVSGAVNISLADHFAEIKNSKARIIVFIGTLKDQKEVIRNCLELAPELIFNGYQWIAVHNSMYRAVYLNSSRGIEQDNYKWVQGLIGLQNSAATNSPEYKKYRKEWYSTPFDIETPSIYPNDTKEDIPIIANFAYDACLMFAHALHQMIEKDKIDPTLEENRSSYLSILKNISFSGVSGIVSVDRNGDRSPASFDILNFQNDSLVKIGSITGEGYLTSFNETAVIYMHGNRIKPLDLPSRPIIKISRWIMISMITGSIICTILSLFMIILTYSLRQTPVFKASSPTFLILMLIGVGCLTLSVVPRSLEGLFSTSTVVCILDLWLANISYTLIIGTLLIADIEQYSSYQTENEYISHKGTHFI